MVFFWIRKIVYKRGDQLNVIFIFLYLTIFLTPENTELSSLDSLFVRASVGRFDYLSLNEGARDSISKIDCDTISHYLVNKFSSCSAREFHTIVDILKRMGERSRPALSNGLKSENLNIKISALYTIGEISDSLLIFEALESFEDTNRKVRVNIARIIGFYDFPALIPYMIEYLNDSESRVRLYNLVSLSRLENLNDSFIPYILPNLIDEDINIRSAAAEVLSKFGDRGVEILKGKFIELPYISQFEIIEVLGEIGTYSALQFLVEIIYDSDEYRRAFIYNALSKSETGLEMIERLYENESSLLLRSLLENIKNDNR